MGLIATPPNWSICTDNNSGAPTLTTFGTAVTTGVSSAYGSSVSLLSALDHDASMLVIQPVSYFTAGADAACLADILIDPAGGTSWSSTALIPDLMISQTPTPTSTNNIGKSFHFPVFVPKGASIGAKTKSTHTVAASGRIIIMAHGGTSNMECNWVGQSVVAYGIASGKGAVLTPGVSSAYSAWTDIGATVAAPGKAIQFSMQGGVAAQTSLAGYLEFGVNGTRIGPRLQWAQVTTETSWMQPTGPLYCNIAQGAQLQARACISAASGAQAINVSAYVVH